MAYYKHWIDDPQSYYGDRSLKLEDYELLLWRLKTTVEHLDTLLSSEEPNQANCIHFRNDAFKITDRLWGQAKSPAALELHRLIRDHKTGPYFISQEFKDAFNQYYPKILEEVKWQLHKLETGY